MGSFVRLEVDAGVATLRLDRPPMNALNAQVQDELREAAIEASQRSDVAAVVLYGGEKVFAAGADVKEMADMAYPDMVDRSGALQAAFTAVARIPKPVVAAVTGYALGGGCELALTADFRVAGDNAKLGQPEILLGIVPGAGGTQRLPRLVGPARAKDLILSGRVVGGEEARAIGFAGGLVPAERAEEHALEVAAAVGGDGPEGIRALKAMFRDLERTEARVAYENERLLAFQREGAGLPRKRA